MMPPRFSMETEERGDTAVVALNGELDLAWVDDVKAELGRLERTGTVRRVVLDLRGLAFLDSSGLRMVILANARAREEGPELTIVRGPEHVQHVFEITGMDRELTMVDDPADPVPPREAREEGG